MTIPLDDAVAEFPSPRKLEDPPQLDFERISKAMRQPASPQDRRNQILKLVVVLAVISALFMWLDGTKMNVTTVVSLTVIVTLHELGHWAAMKTFGYRDTGVFLIPFFGGLTVGTKDDAPPLERFGVLMAGPLPGIALACALPFVAPLIGPVKMYHFAIMAIVLNGLNLLPLAFLDGGRMVQLMTLGSPKVEAAVSLAMAAALGYVGIHFKASMFIAMGYAAAILVRNNYRTASAAKTLACAGIDVPANLAEAPESYHRALYDTVQPLLSRFKLSDKARIGFMQGVHARLSQGVPTGKERVLVAVGYVSALIFLGVTFMVVAMHHGKF